MRAVAGPLASLSGSRPDAGDGRPDERRPEPGTGAIPAQATKAYVTRDELAGWANDFGLGARTDEVRRLALESLRAIECGAEEDGSGASRIGGTPTLEASADWPTAHGRKLDFVAQFDLREAALQRSGGAELDPGILLIFVAGGASTVGTCLGAECRVLWRAESTLASTPPGGGRRRSSRSLRLHPELLLPRVWSEPVRSLELGTGEREAWERCRLELARRQGVEPFDQLSRPLLLHRLLGYPDDRRGGMRQACEASASVGDRSPGQASPQEVSRRWQLLAQLSRTDLVGTGWAPAARRLYIWIETEDLRARRFDRSCAILR